MMERLFNMFRGSTPAEMEQHQAIDVRIQDERRLARLAKSEAIDRLFQSVVDDLKGAQRDGRH
jgi:hypothetical protein